MAVYRKWARSVAQLAGRQAGPHYILADLAAKKTNTIFRIIGVDERVKRRLTLRDIIQVRVDYI